MGTLVILVGIGLLSGIVTGLSPCVLPVLPGVLATSAMPGGGAAGSHGTTSEPDRRRPYAVIAGLVTSFAVATLLGAYLLVALGLPGDLLRNVGIAVMVVVGIGLLLPPVGRVLERPFAGFSRLNPRRRGSAFLFGATFGLAFVPCAGPVLATITVIAATSGVQSGIVVLTLAFSVGVAIPLLAFALAGQRMAERMAAVRTHLPLVRRVAGGLLVITGVVLLSGLADPLQRAVPAYAARVQSAIEDNPAARDALGALTTERDAEVRTLADSSTAPRDPGPGAQLSFNECEADPRTLANCGPARDFVGIQTWLNTPEGRPLTMDGLRGQVVLLDFWTYSCINCQRTLPYLTRWDEDYRDDGLTIVGVHSPEFAFEREVDNVIANAADLGVRYPIALDNGFRTWRAYNQRFWPAHYLIDRDGIVRQVHYGEGAYEDTERLIEELLAQPAS